RVGGMAALVGGRLGPLRTCRALAVVPPEVVSHAIQPSSSPGSWKGPGPCPVGPPGTRGPLLDHPVGFGRVHRLPPGAPPLPACQPPVGPGPRATLPGSHLPVPGRHRPPPPARAVCRRDPPPPGAGGRAGDRGGGHPERPPRRILCGAG